MSKRGGFSLASFDRFEGFFSLSRRKKQEDLSDQGSNFPSISVDFPHRNTKIP